MDKVVSSAAAAVADIGTGASLALSTAAGIGTAFADGGLPRPYHPDGSVALPEIRAKTGVELSAPLST